MCFNLVCLFLWDFLFDLKNFLIDGELFSKSKILK